MANPIFIDLGGSTARVDPQPVRTAYVRLTLIGQQVYDNEHGHTVNPAQAFEMYITVDQADALADALKAGRLP